MGFSTYRRLTELEADCQQMRAEHGDLERLANRYEQALLRIAAAGKSDDVESLKAAAREGLGIEEQR